MPHTPILRAVLRAAVLLAFMAPSTSFAQSPSAPPAAEAVSKAAPEAASGLTEKPLVRAEKWMIVAAHPLAAESGRRVLREGGSAVDAAIAAQLVLNVVEPQSSGIGGGGFALYWDAAKKELSAWDGRETAPAAATPDLFLDPSGAPLPFVPAATSGLAVGAPGLLRLLEALHEEGGKLPWKPLFQDAIRHASKGFEVSPRLHASLAFMAPRLKPVPEIRDLFYAADGGPLPVGSTLRQPALANSLRALAGGGADAFYRGPLAAAIVRAARSEPRPGQLSETDLAAYRVIRRSPVCLALEFERRACGMPPPSSGGVASLQILGLMERASPPPQDAAARAHLFLEASRLAYADRNRYLADPDQVAQPIAGLLETSYLSARAALIDHSAAGPIPAEPGRPSGAAGPAASGPGADRPGTTHLTVVDGDGNIVSLTSSIEIAFGAGRMAAGFFLNNQLTDFALDPRKHGVLVANAPGPGKRPLSSMSPTIVFDEEGDRPVLALGSPGGTRIIEYVAHALSGLLSDGLDPAQAAFRPHLSHRNRGPAVEARAEADALAAALAAKGHAVTRDRMVSGLHIIELRSDGTLLGGADPRREGVALGD